jgi:hypothetical protein
VDGGGVEGDFNFPRLLFLYSECDQSQQKHR